MSAVPDVLRQRPTWFAPPRLIPLPLLVLVAAATCAWFAVPDDLALLTRLLTLCLFTLSLYLVTGLGGIATLGHAVPFGGGAYVAGFAATRGLHDPILLLLTGAAAGLVLGVASGAVLLRARGLSQLVLSIALVQLAQEVANKAQAVTGGSDGLTGIEPGPVFGRFAFDLAGHTGYLLALAVVVLALAFALRLEGSPFGLTCRAIKADEGRVRAMGVRTAAVLLRLFAVSGTVAGVGGALAAISVGVVGLDSLGFEFSAEGVVMLVIGGMGGPAGAFLGTAAFVLVQHALAAASPYDWLTIIGLLLILTMRFLPGGLLSLPGRLRRAP